MESHLSELLFGWHPGIEGLGGYPCHWYDEDGKLPCPARDCSLLFDRSNIHHLACHWDTAFHTPNDFVKAFPAPSLLTIVEHHILLLMLYRFYCSVPSCGTKTEGGKELLCHEANYHGPIFSNHMHRDTNHLHGFVSVLRDDGYFVSPKQWLYQAIFTRLSLLIGEDDHLREAIFRRAKADPSIHSTGLDIILSPPNRRPGGPDAPIYIPIPSRDFLQNLRPTEEYLRDVDPSWNETWEDLRRRYATGEI